ncbi:MAG TPA: hypothetical protein VE620_09925 [Myxococcales bacterium]|nr:hypothetical protein [Myxococcales bacterium]
MRAFLGAVLLCSSLPALAQSASGQPAEPEVKEIPIEVPDPTPTGLLIAWKPSILSVRVDSGTGAKFGSDSLEPLRGLARFTFRVRHDKPFFGRFELEGGRFETENLGLGSSGVDWTFRALAGAATRISAGVVLVASAGLITRYEVGRSANGAPTIGVFGFDSNIELSMRLFPTITISGYLEGAITPFPYLAQSNLGDLSDADQVRARFQVSIDITRSAAMDFGYDFTRWHAVFTNASILPTTDRALIIETREHAATFGVRYRL